MGIDIIARFLDAANIVLDIALPWVAIVGIIGVGVYSLLKDIKKHKEKEKGKYKKIPSTIVEIVINAVIIYLIFLWLPAWIYGWTGVKWLAPLLGWIVLFGAGGGFSYLMSNKYGELRGLYSGLGHVGIVFLGWLLGRWIGIFFISIPLLLVYYFILYQFAIAIIPAKKPDDRLVFFDKNNEKRQQFIALVSYVWGIQYPVFVVADEWGREVSSRIPGSQFRRYGAPGIILTRAHQVVGITTGTEFSRLEGQGAIFIRRLERVLEIVDLRRQVRVSWIDVITKDGIPFKAKLFMVFKVNDSSPDQSEGGFPYSRKWLRRLLKLYGVTRTGSSDKTAVRWDERVVKLIEQTARQTLSQRTLNELWQPKDSAKFSNTLVEIGEEVKSILQKRLEEQGVIVFTSRAVDFQFSEGKDDVVIEQQLATWKSSWESQLTQTLAEGEAEADRLQEGARAYAQSMLLRALAEGIQQVTPEMSRYVIATRYINAIQELMKKQGIAEAIGEKAPIRLENIKRQISNHGNQ